jgi:hypothetical protein
MPLTQTQHEQFVAWMEDHLPDFRCPYCQKDHFETGEIITGLWIDPSGVAQTQGPMNPMLQVRCSFCRHVALFDAIPMGLLLEGEWTNPDW